MISNNLFTYRIKSINSIIDGDTIDVNIDLGFSITLRNKVRLAEIDCPPIRNKNLLEKKLGLDAKTWLEQQCHNADKIYIKTLLGNETEKYGRILGYLYINDNNKSLNETMVELGYAYIYNGEKKNTNYEELLKIREIRE